MKRAPAPCALLPPPLRGALCRALLAALALAPPAAGCAVEAPLCPPPEGPCGAGSTCDEADGSCRPLAPSDDCTLRPALCGDSQSCDGLTRRCADNPPAPTVPPGPLIDRVGRPLVNAALSNPFDLTKGPGGLRENGDDTRGEYNRDQGAAAWPTRWASYLAQNLAIYDGLDRQCGNQLGASAMAPRYSYLAAALASDALQLDMSRSSCRQYLAVEVSAVKALGGGPALDDCGGRRLEHDVVDVTYSALISGTLSTVSDGIASDSTFLTSFPYLAAPP